MADARLPDALPGLVCHHLPPEHPSAPRAVADRSAIAPSSSPSVSASSLAADGPTSRPNGAARAAPLTAACCNGSNGVFGIPWHEFLLLGMTSGGTPKASRPHGPPVDHRADEPSVRSAVGAVSMMASVRCSRERGPKEKLGWAAMRHLLDHGRAGEFPMRSPLTAPQVKNPPTEQLHPIVFGWDFLLVIFILVG